MSKDDLPDHVDDDPLDEMWGENDGEHHVDTGSEKSDTETASSSEASGLSQRYKSHFEREAEEDERPPYGDVAMFGPDDGPLQFVPPNIRTSKLGIIGDLLQQYRMQKKRKKLAGEGYVEWLLVGDQYPRRRYIKPDGKKGGIPEFKHDGVTYLFPRDAMVPSKETGMWTFVHKKGDAEPINLRDTTRTAIPVDVLQDYLDRRISSSPPGFLDKFDLDAKTLVGYALGFVILFAVIQGVLSGGIA